MQPDLPFEFSKNKRLFSNPICWTKIKFRYNKKRLLRTSSSLCVLGHDPREALPVVGSRPPLPVGGGHGELGVLPLVLVLPVLTLPPQLPEEVLLELPRGLSSVSLVVFRGHREIYGLAHQAAGGLEGGLGGEA